MILAEVIQNIGSFNEDDTICATRPWTVHSEAVVGPRPEDDTFSGFQRMYGKDYFLEVSIARGFLDDLAASGAYPSWEAKCIRLIQYAENDA
jgi:hypothetical protein